MMQDPKALAQRISDLEQQEINIKQELYKLRKEMPRFEVQDYLLNNRDGSPVRLSELFGKKDELILVHNMGKFCPYCTLWADGFNGIIQHLESRAAFVVSTPDPPEVMDAFASGRGWNFRMASTQGSALKKDLGFELPDGSYYPGVSTLLKDSEGKIWHIAKAFFGPGDDFCAAWYFFDLLAKDDSDWNPKFKY
jgi:predicted dithiol-disulfide oxidoreductase (DUF899 family)